jgi:hypothetical protein
MVSIATIPVVSQYRFDAEKHIHTLDGQPLMGTSTVVGALGKPLTYWAAGCALTPLGWLNRKKSTAKERRESASAKQDIIRDMLIDEYVALLESCYHAHTKVLKDTASAGTNTHKALEHYVQACIDDQDGAPQAPLPGLLLPAVEVFANWAIEHVQKFLWSEKHCYSEELWVGGISDCGALLTTGSTAVIDFKRKGCYYSQFVQIGGYAIQVEENGLFTADGQPYEECEVSEIDELIVFPNDGKLRIEPAEPYMQRFAEVVNIYKHQQEYDND